MANMSYCRWENTYRDLRDCFDSMSSMSEEDLSESEFDYKKSVLYLCKDILKEAKLDECE